MSSLSVVKRNGTKQALDIKKIRNIIQWACEGFDLNRNELEASLNISIKDGTQTTKIQENLIYHALQKTTVEQPEWRFVAGRLLMSELWKNTRLKRQLEHPYQNYWQHLCDFVAQGKYNPDLLNYYSKAQILEISQILDYNLDFTYEYSCVYLLINRYLLEDELPQELFLTNALTLGMVEPEHDRLNWVKKFYDRLAKRQISLATPMLKNLRRSREGNVTSCFISKLPDNLDGIFDVFKRVAQISKAGGGVGVYLSNIRATGSPVGENKNASGGILPWCKILNDIGVAVNQGGTRAGAITIALDIWHLDILNFLECQTENGDQRSKVYDVFPQIVVTDIFMERVENNQDWYLVDPLEVKRTLSIDLPPLWGEAFNKAWQTIEQAILDNRLTRFTKINAKELFIIAMKSLVETGMPYIAFKDKINQANPNKDSGYIPSVNLCVESFSNVSDTEDHCCNLASLNLAQLVEADRDEIQDVCNTAVRIIDNSIDLTITPTPQAKTHNYHYRTIGLGAMGLADYLAYKESKYQDTDLISDLFEQISLFTCHASADLAKERGTFFKYPESEWAKGKLINSKSLSEILSISNSEENKFGWVSLTEKIKEHGIRHSHLLAIAPNTSTSLVMDATASVLPAFARSHEFIVKLGSIAIVAPYVKDHFWYYQENKFLDQKIVIDAISTIQQWIDTGISMELVFNPNPYAYGDEKEFDAKDFFDTLMYAWKKNCKTIYYVRMIDKNLESSLAKEENCSGCAG